MGTARAGPLGHQGGQAALLERRRGRIERRRESPKASAALATGALSSLTRRTVSYLTCTRSRASKNSEPEKAGSLTASGRGFKLRLARRASTLGSGTGCLAISTLSGPH
jgi:hypothetical protein